MTNTRLDRGSAIEVLVVVVLYRMSPRESPAFQSLVCAVSHIPGAPVACVLYDNSPEAHELPVTQLACTYRHDATNPGLAVAYQFALEQAECEGVPWLLLLDQDTTVTTDYLVEALQVVRDLGTQWELGAIVPKLVQDGIVLSPHWPHGHRSRQSFADRIGLMEPILRVYNSGALLRVEAVRAADGFPLNYPLDYLDHAMFARLQAQQRRVFLLHAALPHQLESKSQNLHMALKNSSRLRGTLAAETRFYREYGSRRDRLLLLRRRAKLALGMLLRMQLRSLAALIRCSTGRELIFGEPAQPSRPLSSARP